MANYCFWELHARGGKQALSALVRDMLGTDEHGNPLPRSMARVFSADVQEKSKNDDGTETWTISGECAWSSLVCMTHADPACYGTNTSTGERMPWFIGLEEEAEERGLTIELHDEEPETGFATRITVSPGTPIRIEEFDYCEICYEKGFDDLDELKREHDLTEEEVKALTAGECVIRTDMPRTWSV